MATPRLFPFDRVVARAGVGRAGELQGRACVLIPFVPFDGMWDFHDIDAAAPGDYEASAWRGDDASRRQFREWDIEWVPQSEVRAFVAAHFWHLDADRLPLGEPNDSGALLAALVVDAIADRYPSVAVEYVPAGSERHFATAIFTPQNRDGAVVTLYVNYDESFELHVRSLIVVDMQATEGSVPERASAIVTMIVDVASNGIRRGLPDRLIGNGFRRVGPWRT
ncbi:hypothetical protein MN032_16455 [Agromyces atrinae]|uniref:hypothetical protein n=1 Tax=Agromyces atrinae TaxID=592376 RepID=UPI001F57A19B|nr:hypothetical protein [Agromyces atrinae]MCI2959280.1 hypothetical protein [Agromyces atrinae]